MARLFVRLKLRLIRNGLRAGWQRGVGLVVGGLFALGMAVNGFALLAIGGRHADNGPLVVLGFTGLFTAWMTVPVLGFGTDETLDPTRLALLPLTRRQLMAGLLAASTVGIGPLATALGLLGAVVGYGRLNLGLPIVVAAAALEVALCVTASRAVVTALARLLRTRRGRDLRVIAAALVALLPQLSRFLLEPQPGSGTSTVNIDYHPAARLARWSPPGLAGQAMADASHDHVLPALAELAGAAVFVALLLWWWSRSLERVMTSAEVTATTATAATRRRPSAGRGRRPTEPAGAPLVPRALRWLPANRMGAVAAKEIRYAGRDPRRRIQILMGLLIPLIAMLPSLARGAIHHPVIVLVAVFVSFMFAGTTSLNAFGMDGPPYWANVVAGNDPRADLLGKNLATAALGLPITALVAVGLAVPSNGWGYVPLVVALGAGVIGVGLGVGNVASVRAPQPVAATPSNPWANTSGQGCATGMLSMLAFLGEIVLMIPVAVLIAIGLAAWTPALAIGAVLAVVWGGVVWWLGLRSASRWVWWRLPELLAAVNPP